MNTCSRCGYEGEAVFVHGHLMCPKCHQIPEFGDCCQGQGETEECKDAKDPDDQAGVFQR